MIHLISYVYQIFRLRKFVLLPNKRCVWNTRLLRTRLGPAKVFRSLKPLFVITVKINVLKWPFGTRNYIFFLRCKHNAITEFDCNYSNGNFLILFLFTWIFFSRSKYWFVGQLFFLCVCSYFVFQILFNVNK